MTLSLKRFLVPAECEPTRLDADPPRQVPIAAVTGFLRLGKTMLLRRVLGHPAFARKVVIIDEVAQRPLDHELDETAVKIIVDVGNCRLCRTVRGDLAGTIRELGPRRRRASVMDHERVILETTGLADPAPCCSH